MRGQAPGHGCCLGSIGSASRTAQFVASRTSLSRQMEHAIIYKRLSLGGLGGKLCGRRKDYRQCASCIAGANRQRGDVTPFAGFHGAGNARPRDALSRSRSSVEVATPDTHFNLQKIEYPSRNACPDNADGLVEHVQDAAGWLAGAGPGPCSLRILLHLGASHGACGILQMSASSMSARPGNAHVRRARTP